MAPETWTAIILAITSFSVGLVLAYYGYRFRLKRKDTIFIKRRGKIVTAYTICAACALLIGIPMRIITNNTFRLSLNDPSIATVAHSFYFIFGFIGSFLVFCRYWMIYYDIQFTNSCTSLEWKKCITNNMNMLKKEKWFVDKRGTLGNGTYMTRLSVICAVIIIIISTINKILRQFMRDSWEEQNGIMRILGQIPLFMIAVIFFVLWRKIPRFHDTIYLYQEFQLMAYSCFVITITALIIVMYMIFIGDDLISSIIWNINSMIGAFIVPFISTYWVLKHIDEDMSEEKGLEVHIKNRNSNDTDDYGSLLNKIFADDNALNQFMQHLINEFSMECLLSFIEFHQFKSYGIQLFNIREDEDEKEDFMEVDLPPTIPRSESVYINNREEMNDVELYKHKAYQLYNKYIISGAEFEINISYREKRKLRALISDYDAWIANDDIKEGELIKLFDGCMVEMMQLINSSNSRYKTQN